MSWPPPVSSEEVAERRDAGRPDQDDEHRCDGGWLPEDPLTGAPRPCPVCKPHLAEGRRRLERRLHGPGVIA